MSKFSEDLEKFLDKTKTKLNKVYKESCKKFSIKVCERTGVDTGRLLANYQPGVNIPLPYPGILGWESSWIQTESGWVKDESIASKNKEKALSYTSPRINEVIKKLTYKDTYLFITKENYANFVEYIGWEKTPPYRMFGRTKAEWNAIVEEISRLLKNV